MSSYRFIKSSICDRLMEYYQAISYLSSKLIVLVQFVCKEVNMSQLILSRRPGESVLIGDDIVITVYQHKSKRQVKLVIDAPPDVLILRDELVKTQSIKFGMNGK